jgi:hypothetical protein
LEIKEILEKMRRVNQIWLTTMGEDEGNVSVITGWLREFIGNKNPKSYEGVVSPAIWVGTPFPPPNPSSPPSINYPFYTEHHPHLPPESLV